MSRRNQGRAERDPARCQRMSHVSSSDPAQTQDQDPIEVIDRLRITKDVRGLGGANRDSAHNMR